MGGTVTEYLQKEFGGRFEVLTDTFTLGATQKQILPNNPNRFALILFNVSTISQYVLNANDVSSTNGFVLDAAGGLVSFQARDDFHLPTQAWYGVAASGTPKINYIEILRFA